MELGHRIRARRQELGLSLRELAGRVGLTASFLSQIERDLAALTVCVSRETAALVKERIHKFREEITQLCDEDPQGTSVYQLNVQWFPLSATEPDAGEGKP